MRCDEIASQVCGETNMASALVKVVGYGTSLQNVNYHFADLLQNGQTFVNYPAWFSQNRDQWVTQVAETVAAANTARTKAFDSHPALRARLEALAVTPEEATRYVVDDATSSIVEDMTDLERQLTDGYGQLVYALLQQEA